MMVSRSISDRPISKDMALLITSLMKKPTIPKQTTPTISDIKVTIGISFLHVLQWPRRNKKESIGISSHQFSCLPQLSHEDLTVFDNL